LGRIKKTCTSRYITQLPLASAKKAIFGLFKRKTGNYAFVGAAILPAQAKPPLKNCDQYAAD
jgi:hypothetical protein